MGSSEAEVALQSDAERGQGTCTEISHWIEAALGKEGMPLEKQLSLAKDIFQRRTASSATGRIIVSVLNRELGSMSCIHWVAFSGPGLGLRVCISNRIPSDDANAADL